MITKYIEQYLRYYIKNCKMYTYWIFTATKLKKTGFILDKILMKCMMIICNMDKFLKVEDFLMLENRYSFNLNRIKLIQ